MPVNRNDENPFFGTYLINKTVTIISEMRGKGYEI